MMEWLRCIGRCFQSWWVPAYAGTTSLRGKEQIHLGDVIPAYAGTTSLRGKEQIHLGDVIPAYAGTTSLRAKEQVYSGDVIPAQAGIHMLRGSVLVFSLIIMGMVTLLTQQLLKSVSVGIVFGRTMIARERAEMLALGGVRIAIAQLARSMQPEEKKKGEQPAKKQDQNAPPAFSFKNFITHVLPHLERWQQFDLTQEHDQMDGTIKISISAEEGKVPLNTLFDERKREVTPTTKALFKPFGIKKKVQNGAMATKLGKFFKKRSAQVAEISELAGIAKDTHLPLFYEPETPKKKKGEDEKVRDIALQNLFTTWPKEKKINPLFLSDALCAVLKVRRPLPTDAEKRKDRFQQLAEQFNKLKEKKDEEIWKSLQLLYETKPKLSKEVMSLFSPVIEPRFFSVLSYGVVGGVTQRVLAVIERTQVTTSKKQTSTKKEQAPQKVVLSSLFKIRRLYWV